MFAEMSCKCGSTLQLDGLNDAFTEFTTIRFLEAHVGCGFVTPVKKDEPDKTTKRDIEIKRIVFKDDDED
jgi:hypothetical protein